MERRELELKVHIDENDNYSLDVVRLPDMDLDTYGVTSKKFGVLEMSTSVLANARKFLAMLDKWEKDPDSETGVEGALPDLPMGPMN